jgi:hypothetical protein
MEVSQGNSLCSYLKQTILSFPILFFSDVEGQKVGRGPALGVIIASGRGRKCRIGVRG